MHNVSSGTYGVTATAGGSIGVSDPIVVSAGTAVSDVVVRLERGGHVEVHVKEIENEYALFACSRGAIVAFVSFAEPRTSRTPELLLPEGDARILLVEWGSSGYEIIEETTATVLARERRAVELDGMR